jgi:hypothetical protein
MMSVRDIARTWGSLEEADKRWLVDHVGEYLEKNAGVTSDAGRLGRTDGVDSRDLIAALDYACQQIKEGK